MLKNVLAADATLLFSVRIISGEPALTLRMAQQNHKPCLHIDLKSVPEEKAISLIQAWLGRVKPGTLNIAGSREWSTLSLWHLMSWTRIPLDKVHPVLGGDFLFQYFCSQHGLAEEPLS